MPEERSCFPEPMLDKGARCVKCNMLLLPLLSYLCVSTPFEIYCSENINTSILKHFYILYTFESHRKWVPVRQPLNYCLWLRTKGICFKDTSGYQKEGQGCFFCGVFVSFEFWALERCLAIARWTSWPCCSWGRWGMLVQTPLIELEIERNGTIHLGKGVLCISEMVAMQGSIWRQNICFFC